MHETLERGLGWENVEIARVSGWWGMGHSGVWVRERAGPHRPGPPVTSLLELVLQIGDDLGRLVLGSLDGLLDVLLAEGFLSLLETLFSLLLQIFQTHGVLLGVVPFRQSERIQPTLSVVGPGGLRCGHTVPHAGVSGWISTVEAGEFRHFLRCVGGLSGDNQGSPSWK